MSFPWLSSPKNLYGYRKLAHVVSLKARIGWQNLRTDEFVDEGPYCVTGTDFIGGKIDWSRCYHVSKDRYGVDENIQLQIGDLLVTKDGTIGKVAVVDCLPGLTTLNSGVFVVRPKVYSLSTTFLRWVIQSGVFESFVDYHYAGSTINHLYQNVFEKFRFPYPSLEAQKHIADFLDRETARIDQLIEKKKRLAELLKESRAAFANSMFFECTLTVPYIALRRFLMAMCDGPFGSGLKSSHYVEEGIRVIRLQNIGRDEFRDRDAAFIDPQHYETLGDHDVVAGDLLIAGLGDTNYPVGRACVAPEGIEPAMVKADCFRLRFDQRHIRHNFLAKYLSSPTGAAEIARRSKGVTRNRINLEILAGLPVPYLPIAMQDTLSAALDEKVAKLELVDAKLFQSIDRLREYRSALITAVVTGQIDVATWGKRGNTDRQLNAIEAEMGV